MSDQEAAPPKVVALFQEKRKLQTQRRELREANLKAKQNYASLNVEARTVKLQLVQKFLNKLKMAKPVDRELILKEIDTFYLQRYLSEITVQICEQPITDADVMFFVTVCSKLHQSYEEFQEMITNQIIKTLKQGIEAKEKDENVIAGKKRDWMRMLFELFVVGFAVPPEKVFECFREITVQPDPRLLVVNLPTACMFAKYFSYEVLRKRGITLSRLYNKYDELDSIFEYDAFLSQDKITKFNFGLTLYQNQLKDQLKYLYDIKSKEENRLSQKIQDDEMTKRDEDRYHRAMGAYTDMLASVREFMDNLEFEFEVNFGRDKITQEKAKIQQEKRRKQQEENERIRLEGINLYTSKDERAFYEDLFDLKLKLPEQLFNLDTKPKLYGGEDAPEEIKENDEDVSPITPLDHPETQFDPELIPTTFREFEGNLFHCINQERADLLAEQFMYINTSENRRNLYEALVLYRREYLLIVPFLCRFVAVLNNHFPEIGEELLLRINKSFEVCRESPKQDFTTLQKKIHYVRFMSELAKFNVLELFKILNVIKSFADDFGAPGQLELLYTILDHTGQFIYNNEETRFRFTKVLEQLTTQINEKLETLNAETVAKLRQVIDRPAQEKQPNYTIDSAKSEFENFIYFLIEDKLQHVTLTDVSLALNHLKWNNELENYCFEALLNRSLTRNDGQLCVSLLVALNQPVLLARLIDELLEILTEEKVSPKRSNAVHFLSEMYAQGLVSLEFILRVCYAILGEASASLGEAGVVCQLLEPVRHWANRKAAEPSVLRLLIWLQSFALVKSATEKREDVLATVQETIETIDGGSTRLLKLATVEHAQELIAHIETSERASETPLDIEMELKVFLGKLIQKNLAAARAAQ